MNISQRLRTCARHTGLDAVIELLNEAADEIDAMQARAQVHPAQADVTDELCWQIWDKAGACDEVNERVTLKVAKPIIRAIVAAYLEVAAHHGITAQAKKEDK